MLVVRDKNKKTGNEVKFSRFPLRFVKNPC
jgi:hypothetical protein